MSSSIQHRQSGEASEVGWLEPHSDSYLAELSSLNYAPRTIARHKCAVAAFVAQADLRGVDATDIDESVLAELRGAVPELRSATEQRHRQGCIARFIEHLVDAGAIGPLPLAPPLLFRTLSDRGFAGLFRALGRGISWIVRSLPWSVGGVSDGRRRVKPLRGSFAALRPFG